jgi:hypothetical protein
LYLCCWQSGLLSQLKIRQVFTYHSVCKCLQEGQTPLYKACLGSPPMISLLFDAGADLCVKDQVSRIGESLCSSRLWRGRSPLAFATSHWRADSCILLKQLVSSPLRITLPHLLLFLSASRAMALILSQSLESQRSPRPY